MVLPTPEQSKWSCKTLISQQGLGFRAWATIMATPPLNLSSPTPTSFPSPTLLVADPLPSPSSHLPTLHLTPGMPWL